MRTVPTDQISTSALPRQFRSRRCPLQRAHLDRCHVHRWWPGATHRGRGHHFRAAKFQPNLHGNAIWKTIIDSWANIYTGIPHCILTDQGSSFGEMFTNMCRIGGVHHERTGIEAYLSLNLGEHYHQPLGTVFRKLLVGHPNADKHLTLALSVKAMNDTLGPDGFIPTSLVLASILKSSPSPRRHQVDRPSSNKRK